MATTIIKSTDSDNQAKVDNTGHLLITDGGQPLNVTGNLTVGSGFITISPGYPTQVTVGTTSVQLFPAYPTRKYAHIFNNSTQAIYIQYQSSAAPNQGIKIAPGSFFTLDSDNLWLGVVNAIGIIAGQMIDVLQGE